MKPYLVRFGDRALVDIRTADVQDFIADLRKPRAIHRRGVRVLSASRVNKIIDLLRHMFNWAVGREYIDHTPFRRGSETLIKNFKEDNKRRRRIDEQEEAALLAHAPRHIQALLIAAIDTGMRSGEMLALRFADIDLERGLITLRGETTKSRKTRLVPISTTRLRDVLTWLRQDVEGKPKPLETRVFSNEVGEPYRLFHRQWQSIVLKAHGHTPTWNPRLTTRDCPTSRRRCSGASTCGGTTCGTSTRRVWWSTGCRSRRCGTCSGMRRSPRPSGTTTRQWRTCGSPPPSPRLRRPGRRSWIRAWFGAVEATQRAGSASRPSQDEAEVTARSESGPYQDEAG